MKKIRLFSIGWDITDGSAKDFDLPDEVIIESPDQELIKAAENTLKEHEAAEELVDYLMNKYEFNVYEFGIELLA